MYMPQRLNVCASLCWSMLAWASEWIDEDVVVHVCVCVCVCVCVHVVVCSCVVMGIQSCQLRSSGQIYMLSS